jgi:outer membrane biosynthesis protein TonB
MGEDKRQTLFSNNRTVGWILSLLIHILLILFVFFLPHFVKEEPEDAYEGILVSFGLPVESASSEEASQSIPIEEESEIPEMEERRVQNVQEELESTLLEEENPVLAKQSEERKPEEKKPSRPQKEEQVSEENQLDKAKDAFSQLFNRSNDKGNTPKQSGDPLGEPDASILEGLSKGKGQVGGGLDARGVLFEPQIVEQSQKSGRVVVRVCVDSQGKVFQARYTQRGSTTTDRDLVKIAEISAMKYRFSPSSYEEQCGTITINFIVQ